MFWSSQREVTVDLQAEMLENDQNRSFFQGFQHKLEKIF